MAKTSRQQIIETAEALIMEKQTPEISLTQISDKLGLTHGALYKHFQNKQALWTAVAAAWFQREILDQLDAPQQGTTEQRLHDWLWDFVNAKKQAFNTNPQMFSLNTQYLDNNPAALRTVLQEAYAQMNVILGLSSHDTEHAELILATFAIFTLPTFKDTWNDSDYQHRFEAIWDLIKAGI